MAIIVYNPKFIEVKGQLVPNTTDVKNFVWSHARWSLEAGKMSKFPDDVGQALLKHMEFLVEVTKDNYDKIKAESEDKKFKCDKCAFETDTKIAFVNHVKAHSKGNMLEDSVQVEEAKPVGNYAPVSATPKAEEDIPQGGTKYNPVNDKDGVGWYGGGLERDTL